MNIWWAANRSPLGTEPRIERGGNTALKRDRYSERPDCAAALARERAAALLQREAAHLTRRDGHRRRLVDHGDGTTIEEADRAVRRAQPSILFAAL